MIRRPLFLWPLVFSGLLWPLRGQEAERSHPECKDAILSNFSYVAPRTETAAPPSPHHELLDTPATLDPNAVLMDEFQVKSTFWDRDLAADIHKTKPLKAKSEAKFGTGVYQKDFGKVSASVVTILYVPIMVGASW